MSEVNVAGLILAAGRGSRLLNLTDDRPKGLVKLNDRSLVEWQIDALKIAGIQDIRIVNGYLGHMFELFGYPTITNENWSNTNMVGSLMCALSEMEGPLIISYSDIVYHPAIVKGLLATEGDLVITYDIKWLDLWSDRFDNPLSDAESFKIDEHHHVLEIGQSVNDINDIQGQFMGLLKISKNAISWINELIAEKPERTASLDTTAMLNLLIKKGHVIHGYETAGNWCEVDDQSDLKVAENYIKSGKLCLA
jgi:L-glutamine-phosphate cytidylyltransferase